MTNGDSEKLDILIHQVGLMTEGITELRIVVTEGFSELKQSFSELRGGFSEIKEGFSEIKEGFSEIKEGFSEIKEVAQQQGDSLRLLIEQGAQRQQETQLQQQSIDRLIGIVETLIQQQNQQ